MKVYDQLTLRGVFQLKVFRSGKLVRRICEENLIVDGARAALAMLAAGDGAGLSVAKVGFGTNGDSPEHGDTELSNDAVIKNVSGHDYPAQLIDPLTSQVIANGPGIARFQFVLLESEGNGLSIIEFGLFTATDVLFSRKVRSGSIEKESDIRIEGDWSLVF